jgi:hypothetical protein
MPKLKHRTHRVRDFLLYIVISLAIVGLVGLFAVHAAKTGQRIDGAFKWMGFVLNTAFVFGSSIKVVRPLVRRRKLWAIMAVLFLLHGIIGALAVSQIERIPLIWYVPLDVVEITVITRVITWAFARMSHERHSIHA